MRKQLLIATAALVLAHPAQAAPPPSCNDEDVQLTFAELQSAQVLEIAEWKGKDGKSRSLDDANRRWCYAFVIHFAGLAGMRASYMETLFTVEWIVESEGTFTVHRRILTPTCRGITGNPWSMKRCG